MDWSAILSNTAQGLLSPATMAFALASILGSVVLLVTIDGRIALALAVWLVAYLALIRAGCGIGFAQARMMQDASDIVELDFGLDLPHLPVWLAAPQAMRSTPRIARVWELLTEGLTPVLSRA